MKMEEVDQIILDQLNRIGCGFDGEIKNLNKIENHDLVNALIKCVQIIDPKLWKSTKFNENMNITEKYRIATDLANAIKELGYKAEIGYQTFLYFSEKESRRLFLFLFDKLSKKKQEEPSKNGSMNFLNRLNTIEIDFNEVKKEKTELRWKTNGLEYLNYFMKNEDENFLIPFDNPSLFIEWNSMNLNTNSKLFSNFYTNSKLVLNKESIDLNSLDKIKMNDKKLLSDSHSPSKSIKELNVESTENSDDQDIKKLKEYLDHLEKKLENNRRNLNFKENELKSKKECLEKLNEKLDAKNFEIDKVRYSDRSNEELKDGVYRMKSEINEVNKKWQLFNLEYNESIDELKQKKKLIINKFNEFNEEIQLTRNQIEINTLKLKKIDKLITELEQNIGENNDLDRKFYTKRIFEIINNVKKQEQDIHKILIDIRNLQSEINQLSGKANRTYTVVEEIVLKNSNLNDWFKRCYRLISELDEIYNKLISEIESCGQTKREKLRFEEILESEKPNKIGMNLAKVTFDLEQIRKENKIK